MNSRDFQIVKKMIKYCEEIFATHKFFNSSFELFKDSSGFVYRNSITMPIMQIGELAKLLSDDFLKEHNTISWREIKGMRDFFAHHYGLMDYNIVWDTSHKDITKLHKYLSKFL